MKKIVVPVTAFDNSEIAKYRLKVVMYYRRFGLKATLAAFPVSRSNLFLWQQKLFNSRGSLVSLIPRSTKPKSVRSMSVHPAILSELKRLRHKHYRLGKKKLHPFIKALCQKEGIDVPSVSTLGKTISRYHLFYSRKTYGLHDPKRKRYQREKKLRVRYAPKPSEGGYVEADTIETYVMGHKKYTVTAIDVKLKVSCAMTFVTKSAKNTIKVLEALQAMLPVPIHTVQTDNGSEFEGVFELYLHKQGITHIFIYPHSPRINGTIERFNRTIQEEWIESYLHEMDNLKKFNNRLAEYLYFYNNQRIHESLGDRTPASILGKEIQSPKGA